MDTTQLICPSCKSDIALEALNCSSCGRVQVSQGHLDLCMTKNNVNEHTEAAYKIYSKYYAPLALLAYLIVWRGNFLRHVAFFRELALRGTRRIVDLATGDGSLTALALFKGPRKKRAEKVVAIDISSYMLSKARRKLPAQDTVLVRGDVMQLPLRSKSVDVLSCFGGFNSFPSGQEAMKEMARVLAPQGVLRGSLLLMPETPWRQRLVQDWITKGYQTDCIDPGKFQSWVAASGLVLSHTERHGDVLLFELRQQA